MPCLLPFWKLHYDIMGGNRRSVALPPAGNAEKNILRRFLSFLALSCWGLKICLDKHLDHVSETNINISNIVSKHLQQPESHQSGIKFKPRLNHISQVLKQVSDRDRQWLDSGPIEISWGPLRNNQTENLWELTSQQGNIIRVQTADTSNCSLSANVWRQFRFTKKGLLTPFLHTQKIH